MNSKFRKAFSITLALAVAVSAPLSSLAATWDVANGDISIKATEEKQTVTQGDNSEEDDAPVITGETDDVTITLESEGDSEVNVTIKDVKVTASEDSIIDVVDDTEAEVTFEGENKFVNNSGNATIHVAEGDLTIEGGGKLTLEEGRSNESAIIGTNSEEDLSGSITISGDVTVDAEYHTNYGDGADIGTGYKGDVTKTGKITIEENANVKAHSQSDGAGIGSGEEGEMNGTIIITDNAVVEAQSDSKGAGVGSGEEGHMRGTVLMDGKELTAVSGDDGAGIGSGDNADLFGTIKITGGEVTATSEDDGAGIGTGEGDNDDGDDFENVVGGHIHKDALIYIGGNAEVTANAEDEGAGIGTGENGDLRGSIIIEGSSDVYAKGDDESSGIGTGEEGEIAESGKIIIGGSSTVKAVGEGQGCGIGSGQDDKMKGEITIRDNADVTAWAGYSGAAIGAEDSRDFEGTINILDNAKVTTGVANGYGGLVSEYVGYIGCADYSHHDDENGHFNVGENATINGIRGSEIEKIGQYVNYYIDENGKAVNYTVIFEPEEEEELLFKVEAIAGNSVKFLQERKGSEFFVTTEEDHGRLIVEREVLENLYGAGVRKVTFTTKTGTISFDILKLLNADKNAEIFTIVYGENFTDYLADNVSVKHIIQ